jgi:hypothetical protein
VWCNVEWCGVAPPWLPCMSASLFVVCMMCAVVCGVECVCVGGVVWCRVCGVVHGVWCSVCVYCVVCGVYGVWRV